MLNITMSRLYVKSCKTLEKIGLPGASENDFKRTKNKINNFNISFSFIFTVSWRIRKGTSGSTLVRRKNQYEWPKAAKDRLRNISFLLYIPILGKEIRHLCLRLFFSLLTKSDLSKSDLHHCIKTGIIWYFSIAALGPYVEAPIIL